MRDIREETNPYRDDYREWDYWGYLNSTSVYEANGNYSIWYDLPGRETLYMSVDSAGWLVPQLTAFRQQMERMKYGAAAVSAESACTNSFTARGEPGRLLYELEEEKLRIKATFIPPVPLWLTNGPPESAMLLPDGEVVTYGEVGNQDIMWPDRRFDLLRHYRYDPEGNILDQTEPGQPWWNLYFDLEGEMAKYGEDSGLIASRPGYVGIIHHTDEDDGVPTQLEWFTYRGAKATKEQNEAVVDRTHFMEIYAAEIPVLYELQQAAAGNTT